ncbi:O-antigen ligase family protein [Mucilaginibacter psychrotolerans]|uniref:O-antigen ligase family protein n=1 Tax=Mucilaginibacter psychrotolerans TaxID=1524096 RepID=UPI00130524F3|nr:O-antigen ligase family protein [Mucilaginibacter psychrotolerans]
MKKLPWFFTGILLFPPSLVIIPSPSMPFPRLMLYILLFVTLFKEKNWIKQFKQFPFKVPLIILFFLLLCVGLFDERLTLFLQLYRPVTYFLENFFIVFLTFYYVKNINDGLYVFDFIVKLFLLFAIYGMLNYVTRNNEYSAYIASLYGTHDFANDNMITGIKRFRVSSFAWHAIYYGYLVITVLLLETFMFTSLRLPKAKKVFYIIIGVALLINLFLLNSRTPILSLVVGAFIYITFAIKFTKKIAIVFFTIVIGAGAIFFIPKAQDVMMNTINIFTGRGNVKEDGSSMSMRQAQLRASEREFMKNPISGNGFEYITEGLGYSSEEKDRKSNKDLQGFESYYFKLLIEQGILGMVGNLILFVALIVWLVKQYLKVSTFGRKVIVFTSAATAAFLVFIFGTGDMGTFNVFMALLGICIRLVMLNDQRKVIYYSTVTREVLEPADSIGLSSQSI